MTNTGWTKSIMIVSSRVAHLARIWRKLGEVYGNWSAQAPYRYNIAVMGGLSAQSEEKQRQASESGCHAKLADWSERQQTLRSSASLDGFVSIFVCGRCNEQMDFLLWKQAPHDFFLIHGCFLSWATCCWWQRNISLKLHFILSRSLKGAVWANIFEWPPLLPTTFHPWRD